MVSNRLQSRAWIAVDGAALRRNYRTIRDRIGERAAMIPMVKADGYGLGAERVVDALEPLEPFAFGVAAAEEGLTLRRHGVRRPILVFTPLSREGLAVAAEERLTPAISSLDALAQWAQLQGGPFHLEIDTGMGRAGFDWREIGAWAPRVRELAVGPVQLKGVYTHFHGADSADGTATAVQWQRFRDSLAQLPVSSEDLMLHACNSAAAVRWPEYALDAVRPGIFLYGGEAAPGVSGVPKPQAVASVHARVVLVRDVPPASTVGYGATHVSKGWERWATVAIGYGDGLPRVLGNTGSAIVNGRRVRIVGRISMDMTVVDVTGVAEVQPGDVATFIGAEGEEEILVDEVAAQSGTISYEILTGFTPRLPRLEP